MGHLAGLTGQVMFDFRETFRFVASTRFLLEKRAEFSKDSLHTCAAPVAFICRRTTLAFYFQDTTCFSCCVCSPIVPFPRQSRPFAFLCARQSMAASAMASRIGMCLLVMLLGVDPRSVFASHSSYQRLSVGSANKSSEPYGWYRTAYHFQPSKNWMNDPNGPMYYKGYYHLFYQYNPKGAVWGNIIWGHAVSKDLVHWQSLEPAIVPSEWYDIKGCWSGSATFLPDGRGPVLLYTGWDNSSRQVQNMAVPKNLSDPFLREWIKSPDNPILLPLDGINSSSFRDPTTGWVGPDGHWRIAVGNKRRRTGIALLYRSKDFIKWKKAKHPLHSSEFTGMWECPDFFPVSVSGKNGLDTSATGPENVIKHVLKVSLDDFKHEYYTIGTYLRDSDRYLPDNSSADNETGLRYDYGKFYASKTFYDDFKKRRVLWAWVNESDSVSDDNSKGWAGLQAIPRQVWLDGMGGRQLIQWPVKELESLRRQRTSRRNMVLKTGQLREIPVPNAAQVDVEVVFDVTQINFSEIEEKSLAPNTTAQELCSQKGSSDRTVGGPFGLVVLASGDLAERTAVYFQVVKLKSDLKLLLCSDQSRSSLQTDVDKTTYGGFVLTPAPLLHIRALHLRVLVDHSIVESFGEGGRTCITARAYPSMAVAQKPHLFVFNNATSAVTVADLSAWHMLSASSSTS